LVTEPEPEPALAQPAPAPQPAAPRVAAAARCGEGYQPSTQFVRSGWLGAYDRLKAAASVWVDGDEPTTAEQARDGMCLQTSGIVGMPPNQKVHCKGDYWVISTDHYYYTDHTYVVAPLADEVVVFDAGLIGGGLCTGEQGGTMSSVEVELHGRVLHVVLRAENYEWSPVENPGEECLRSHTDVADYTYDLHSGLGCEAFHVE
jgi:hypothetical protein